MPPIEQIPGAPVLLDSRRSSSTAPYTAAFPFLDLFRRAFSTALFTRNCCLATSSWFSSRLAMVSHISSYDTVAYCSSNFVSHYSVLYPPTGRSSGRSVGGLTTFVSFRFGVLSTFGSFAFARCAASVHRLPLSQCP